MFRSSGMSCKQNVTLLSSIGCKMIGWNEITGDNIHNEARVKASVSEKVANTLHTDNSMSDHLSPVNHLMDSKVCQRSHYQKQVIFNIGASKI